VKIQLSDEEFEEQIQIAVREAGILDQNRIPLRRFSQLLVERVLSKLAGVDLPEALHYEDPTSG